MIYLIQGLFLFEKQKLGIGYDKGNARVLFHEVMQHSMFAGVIRPDQEDSEALVGTLTDHYGNSLLMAIQIKGNTLLFTKIYGHRADHIHYQFKKDADGTWSGTFHGKTVGTGQARCILTPVPESFLLPVEIVKAANRRLKLQQ